MLRLLWLGLGYVAAKKVIAVMGATGMQGGAVVDAILADGTFECRALTRDATSEKARALESKGCKVVEADADKPKTLEKAFKGADGAFLLTNFWEHHDGEREYKQAVGAADAANAAGVKHIVWSTLEPVIEHDNIRELIPKIGNYKVPHFDAKAQATHYMKSKLYPVTYLYTTFYMENFWFFGMLSRVDDTHYEIVLPMQGSPIPMMSMHDLGLSVLEVFKHPAEYINQDYKLISDLVTPKDIGAKLAAAAGVEVEVKEPPPLVFAKFGFPGAEDLGHMFLYFSAYADVWATYHRVKHYEEFGTFLRRNSKALKEYIANTNAKANSKKNDL